MESYLFHSLTRKPASQVLMLPVTNLVGPLLAPNIAAAARLAGVTEYKEAQILEQ